VLPGGRIRRTVGAREDPPNLTGRKADDAVSVTHHQVSGVHSDAAHPGGAAKDSRERLAGAADRQAA
jgi:hypothetical protein